MNTGLHPTNYINSSISTRAAVSLSVFPKTHGFLMEIWVGFLYSRSVCRSSCPSKKPNLLARPFSLPTSLLCETVVGYLPTFLWLLWGVQEDSGP